MHRTGWTPSIVPTDNDETVYLVAADFGRLGRAWPEADYEATDLETVIQDLLSGQTTIRSASSPSTPKCGGRRTYPKTWLTNCADAADLQMREPPSSISDFIERYEAHDRRQLSLR